jgi:hypothetical protein
MSLKNIAWQKEAAKNTWKQLKEIISAECSET